MTASTSLQQWAQSGMTLLLCKEAHSDRPSHRIGGHSGL
jgi:hypothetical protein